MEHRDGLITRIEKSASVIEDTKEACQVAIMKKNDLYLNLLKNQKRVQELTAKDFDLSCEIEKERNDLMASSSMLDFVAQELNGKNGVLLQLEIAVEELQKKKNMLEKNWKTCKLEIEMNEKRNSEVENRIRELRDEYFVEESA